MSAWSPMAVGAFVAALLGSAVWMMRRAGSGSGQGNPHPATRIRRQRTPSAAVARGAVVGGVVLLVTRWPVLAAVVGMLAAKWHEWLGDDDADRERARVTAIAKWLEDIRDMLRGSSTGAEEALDHAARRASDVLQPEMTEYLASRRRGVRIDDALRTLGVALHHPMSDAAVAAMGLVLSGTVGAGRLYGTVDALAASARAELVARERIDRTRATYGSTMKRLVLIGGLLVVYLSLAGRELVKSYDTATGQLALCLPLGLWAGCVMWLRSLRRYGGAQ